MTKEKIDISKLNKMLRKGRSGKECAKFFNVTPSAISQAKKGLNIAVVKSVVLENAHRAVSSNLDLVAQLQKINEKCNRLLDEIQDDPGMSIKLCAEIRAQLALQISALESLYNLKAAEEFQREVLQIISEVDKNAKEEIIRRLHEKRSLRQSVRPT